MKKIFYILAIVTLMNSCEKNLPDHSYNSGSYVAFEVKETQGKESATEIKVPVMLADIGRTEQVTVDFAFDETYVDTTMISAVLDTDFRLKNESNTLTFEPGVGSANIIIEPVDDIFPLKDKVIKITLTSNSKSYPIGFPGPDQLNSSCIVVIQEDDCPLIDGVFDGNVVGKETPVGQTWWEDYETNWKWEMIQEVEPGLVEYNVTGFWAAQFEYWQNLYGDALPFTYYPVKVTIDVRNPANPRYSIEEKICATCSYGDYYTKSIDNEPLPVINVCGEYVELPYTLNSGWPAGYTFNVKFQF